MMDPLARRIASGALAIALIALVLAGWSLMETQNRDLEIRALTAELQRMLEIREQRGMSRPPLEFDEGGTFEFDE